MVRTIASMLVISAFLVTSQVFLKTAILKLKEYITVSSFLQHLWLLFFSKYFWGASICMLISGILWLYVIREAEISLVYPLISFSYILMAIVSRYFFDERITLHKTLGIAIICIGIVILFWETGSRGG